VVLCCGGVALTLGRTALEVGPAGAAAGAYVGVVLAGDDTRALEYVCGDSKAAHDAFASHLRGRNVTGHRVVGTSVTTWNLSLHATVRVEVSGSSGLPETVTLPMVKEDGTWKVCDR
jgi:hypothetical protein